MAEQADPTKTLEKSIAEMGKEEAKKPKEGFGKLLDSLKNTWDKIGTSGKKFILMIANAMGWKLEGMQQDVEVSEVRETLASITGKTVKRSGMDASNLKRMHVQHEQFNKANPAQQLTFEEYTQRKVEELSKAIATMEANGQKVNAINLGMIITMPSAEKIAEEEKTKKEVQATEEKTRDGEKTKESLRNPEVRDARAVFALYDLLKEEGLMNIDEAGMKEERMGEFTEPRTYARFIEKILICMESQAFSDKFHMKLNGETLEDWGGVFFAKNFMENVRTLFKTNPYVAVEKLMSLPEEYKTHKTYASAAGVKGMEEFSAKLKPRVDRELKREEPVAVKREGAISEAPPDKKTA